MNFNIDTPILYKQCLASVFLPLSLGTTNKTKFRKWKYEHFSLLCGCRTCPYICARLQNYILYILSMKIMLSRT